jgi:hypothetical protein
MLLSIKAEEGLTLEQLAERVGMTLGAVKSSIYRAQKRMKEGVAEPVPDEVNAMPRKQDTVEGNRRILNASALLEDDLAWEEDPDLDDGEGENFLPFPGSSKPIKKVGPEALMITSLEDLYELFGVDIDEWVLNKSVLNFWGNWNNPNSQGKVWITPLHPDPVLPLINPVKIDVTFPKRRKPRNRKSLKVFLFPDPHIGFERELTTGKLYNFHDRRAMDVAIQLILESQPDVVVLLGDIMDLAEWSDKFFKTPESALVTRPALFETAWWITQIRLAAPNAEIVYLEGNHEQRIPKLIATYLPPAFDLVGVSNVKWPVLSIPNLLDLDTLGVTWVPGYPRNEYWIGDNFRVVHGETVRAKSGATSQVVVAARHYGEAFGHIHRVEIATKTVDTRHGKQYLTVISPGCLSHIDGRVPGKGSHYNWQNGVGEIELIDGRIQPSITYIHEGVALRNGKEYVGSPRVAQIMRDTGMENLVDAVVWKD